MIIPNNEECVRVIKELTDEPSLTEWEDEFVTSCATRTFFTDKQKEVIAKLKIKYDV